MLKHFKLSHLFVVALLVVIDFVTFFPPEGFSFTLFQFINLLPNQLGHMFFSFFGSFTGYLGGPLTMVAFPFSILVYLLTSGRMLAAALVLVWVSQNLVYISYYAGDARAQEIILEAGGDHIWNWMLGNLGLLSLDQFISDILYMGGVLLFLAALAVGLLAARKPLGPAALAEQGSF